MREPGYRTSDAALLGDGPHRGVQACHQATAVRLQPKEGGSATHVGKVVRITQKTTEANRAASL